MKNIVYILFIGLLFIAFNEKANAYSFVDSNYIQIAADEIEDWSPKSFCETPKVKATFRIIGWVFFFIKIVVPIILIVFGAVDFFKAMTSDRDDEIKKSAMKFLKRCILGIIIFFIPSFLQLIVNVIGASDMYKDGKDENSFTTCTHCMLNPSDEDCGTLIGGAK